MTGVQTCALPIFAIGPIVLKGELAKHGTQHSFHCFKKVYQSFSLIIDFIYSQARVCNTQGKGIKGIKPEVCGKYQTCRAHTKRQRNYLRFLYSNRRCAQGLRDLPHTSAKCHPEVRGKSEICRPGPGFGLQRPAVLFSKRHCALRFSIFPRTSGKRGPVSRVPATMAASATASRRR